MGDLLGCNSWISAGFLCQCGHSYYRKCKAVIKLWLNFLVIFLVLCSANSWLLTSSWGQFVAHWILVCGKFHSGFLAFIANVYKNLINYSVSMKSYKLNTKLMRTNHYFCLTPTCMIIMMTMSTFSLEVTRSHNNDNIKLPHCNNILNYSWTWPLQWPPLEAEESGGYKEVAVVNRARN